MPRRTLQGREPPSVEKLALGWHGNPKQSYDRLVARAAPRACSRSWLEGNSSVGCSKEKGDFTNSLITAWERFFFSYCIAEWRWGEESLSHSVAPKLSQRGTFTLPPPGQGDGWKHQIQSLSLAYRQRGEAPASTKHLSLMPFLKVWITVKGNSVSCPVTRWEAPCFARYCNRSLRASPWGLMKPQTKTTAAHELLKWNVPMGVPSMGILNGKPALGGTWWSARHSSCGNEIRERDPTVLSPCWCRTQMLLVRTEKQPPVQFAPSAVVYGAGLAASINQISMDPRESVEPVDYTRRDSLFPLKSLVQSRGEMSHAETSPCRKATDLCGIKWHIILWNRCLYYYSHGFMGTQSMAAEH